MLFKLLKLTKTVTRNHTGRIVSLVDNKSFQKEMYLKNRLKWHLKFQSKLKGIKKMTDDMEERQKLEF